MSAFRKFIVLVLLGLVVGAGLGIGYVSWRLHDFALPGWLARLTGTQILDQVVLTCSGGTQPIVLITWPSSLNSAIGGLERSVGTGPWQPVTSKPSITSGQTHVTDFAVQSGVRYRYRVMNSDGTAASEIATLRTDPANCKKK